MAMILATGGGKTYVMGSIIRNEPGPVCAIAHRQELVGQISLALAREGIRHAILAPASVRRAVQAAHMAELGRNYVDQYSRVKVGGVDTIVRMQDEGGPWFASVRLVVIDEGHHVLQLNKWGTAYQMFPNARGLFPTATFCRADGKGLGREFDGLVDVMIEGPNARELIDAGYLTDYDVYCPRTEDLDLSAVKISETTGELNADANRKAVHKSKRLVGDVVEHYLRIAPGKLGVTFAVDVESATDIAKAYRARGVPAEVVSAKTPDDMRRSILRKFKQRQILQLVNVDLFGEGFDLPAIEVVSMARPTRSFSLFAQQFGRALRVMVDAMYYDFWDQYSNDDRKAIIAASTKPRAIIIDHVGNICGDGSHDGLGLPDKRRKWSLGRSDRKSREFNDAIPLRACLGCTKSYERIYDCCPHCAWPAPLPGSGPGGRVTLTQVDGDLFKLDAETLREMRGEIARIDGPARYPPNSAPAVKGSIQRTHWERQQAQAALRHAMGSWAATYPESDAVNYRRFWFTFGLGASEAMALSAREAGELTERIAARLAIDGYVISEYCAPTHEELNA